MADEFEKFRKKPAQGHNSMAMLHETIEEQHSMEVEIAKMQAALKEKQDALKVIQENTLPELMVELGVESMTTPSGLTVDLTESIHASIPKKFSDKAFDWLDEHGESGMVKRSFEIKFNRDEEAWANKFARDLGQRKKPVNAVIKKKVEPPTLKSWVNTKLSNGEEIPLDLFGVFRRKISKISMKK